MTMNLDEIPEFKPSTPLAPANCSAVWVRSGKIGNMTFDEYVIVEGDSGLPLDRDDPRFFEHHSK